MNGATKIVGIISTKASFYKLRTKISFYTINSAPKLLTTSTPKLVFNNKSNRFLNKPANTTIINIHVHI